MCRSRPMNCVGLVGLLARPKMMKWWVIPKLLSWVCPRVSPPNWLWKWHHPRWPVAECPLDRVDRADHRQWVQVAQECPQAGQCPRERETASPCRLAPQRRFPGVRRDWRSRDRCRSEEEPRPGTTAKKKR